MKRTLQRAIVALVVVLGLGAAALVCQRVAARGRFAVAYSSYGSGPKGARGLYMLAADLGARPIRWAEDLGRLPRRGMLVALGGCDLLQSRELSPFERDTLTRWVERGGVLVVAGAQGYLHPGLGVILERSASECVPTEGLIGMLVRAQQRAQQDAGEPEGETADGGVSPEDTFAQDPVGTVQRDPGGTLDAVTAPDKPPPPEWAVPAANELLGGLGPVPLRSPARVRVKGNARSTTILLLPRGPAGVVVRRGHGVVVALASASVLQNRELVSGEGAVLFSRLLRAYAPRGPVLFDEYHLGVGERRSLMRYLSQVGGGPVVIQVLVVVLLFLWRMGARFGAFRREAKPPPAGTASYVSAIGTLYGKAKDPAGALRIVARHALARIAAHHHVSSGEPGALAKSLEGRARPEAIHAVAQIAALSEQPVLGAQQLMARVKEIDRAVARATESDGRVER